MSIQSEAEDREDDQGHISVELHLGFVGFFFKFMLNESIIKEHLLNEIPLWCLFQLLHLLLQESLKK